VVIVLNLHEQRFEASMREAFELVTAARRHAGLSFVKNEARTIEARIRITHQSTVSLYPDLIRRCTKTFPDPENGNDLEFTRIYGCPWLSQKAKPTSVADHSDFRIPNSGRNQPLPGEFFKDTGV
jgi:hypothetical protein